MLSESSLLKIENLANEVAGREGVVLYDIEFTGSPQGPTLRIFIDKEGGVGIEDCTNVSRGLNTALDELDPVSAGQYNLEVSSPGLERPLRKPWHFQKAIGKKVWLKLDKSLESFGCKDNKLKAAKQISETLLAAQTDLVQVKVGEEEISIPLENIQRAKTVYDFNEGKQVKKGHPKKGAPQK